MLNSSSFVDAARRLIGVLAITGVVCFICVVMVTA